ncbi:hypothetical protein BT69DRAFT_1335663 [Atractiella rhizophila]|nr:hypothetical protein BT69DRAFT_1335663 [Atractiella rhizophila]
MTVPLQVARRLPTALRSRPYSTQPSVSELSSKAQAKASEYSSKATEALKNAQLGSRAQEAWNKSSQYLEGAGKFVGSLDGRISKLTGGTSLVYNFQVFREILRQVYIAEALSPPRSLQAFRDGWGTIYGNASSLKWWKSAVESGEWKRVGIYAIEAYGIFHIGQMIGRRHIVGYKLN